MNRSVIFRIPDDMRAALQNENKMDFMWKFDPPMDDISGKRSTQVLTTVLNNQYCIYEYVKFLTCCVFCSYFFYSVFNSWYSKTDKYNLDQRYIYFLNEAMVGCSLLLYILIHFLYRTDTRVLKQELSCYPMVVTFPMPMTLSFVSKLCKHSFPNLHQKIIPFPILL